MFYKEQKSSALSSVKGPIKLISRSITYHRSYYLLGVLPKIYVVKIHLKVPKRILFSFELHKMYRLIFYERPKLLAFSLVRFLQAKRNFFKDIKNILLLILFKYSERPCNFEQFTSKLKRRVKIQILTFL